MDRAGRARCRIENELFRCMARHAYNLKHHFGHGKDGLPNLLAPLNLLACQLHTVMDSVRCLRDRRCLRGEKSAPRFQSDHSMRHLESR